MQRARHDAPHPERSAEPELGCTDGFKVFQSLVGALATK